MEPSNRAGASGQSFGARVKSRLAELMADPSVIALLLAMVTLALYWPATGFEFVNYDDPRYVVQNTHIHSGLTLDGITWALTTGYEGFWQPLTWLSFMLDATLFGMGPGGFHLTNLLLHSANTVLVFWLFRMLTGAHWPSALVAALFAWHPLRVESVAWVTERKDVLSTFFGLLALLAYGAYVRKTKQKAETLNIEPPTSNAERTGSRLMFHASRFYLLSLFFYTCSLMAKPMLVTLPFVMLLLDYWPLERTAEREVRNAELKNTPRPSTRNFRHLTFNRLLLGKWPFFTQAVLFSVITLLAQKHVGFVRTTAELPVADRMGNAAVSYIVYLGETFWPVKLAIFYPHPAHWPRSVILLAFALLAGMSMSAFWARRKYPFVLTGWFWFIGTLVPVIGLVQVGYQAMADRYTYVPLLGIFIIAVWGVAEVCALGRLPRMFTVLACGLVLAACAFRTRDQLGFWQNDDTLFRHAIAVTRENYPAHYNLGVYLAGNGEFLEAIKQYREAIRIDPDRMEPHLNLGIALENTGQRIEAAREYGEAARLDPANYMARFNLGSVLADLGRREEAIAQFQEVLRLKPGLVLAEHRLQQLGDIPPAPAVAPPFP
jgi:protein O-mannosyl-transferase